MKVTLEITDEQLLDVVAFVKANNITAVFESALLLEVGKKYRNRKGEVVTIEGEECGLFRSGKHLYYANGRYSTYHETPYDLIEEVEEEIPFEMVVGGVYLNRRGREEEIVGLKSHNAYPFVGKSGETYTEKGAFLIIETHPCDLIKRIK